MQLNLNNKAKPLKIKTHAKLPGKFGKISVFDVNGQRWMQIGNEIEGRVYLKESLTTASPIPVSNYAYIGILPCLALGGDAKQHACIFGLGAGMMASLLLNLFPRLKLTVIETDPNIINLCREYFADIKLFESQKRLKIICATAEEFIKNNSHNNFLKQFDFFYL